MTHADVIVLPNGQPASSSAQAGHPSMASIEPEKRLLIAVLEHAVDDFRTYAVVPTGRGRWLFMEVASWFRSPAVGLFDFEGICQATGLDPDFIRGGLRSWYDSALCCEESVMAASGHRSSRASTSSRSARPAAVG